MTRPSTAVLMKALKTYEAHAFTMGHEQVFKMFAEDYPEYAVAFDKVKEYLRLSEAKMNVDYEIYCIMDSQSKDEGSSKYNISETF